MIQFEADKKHLTLLLDLIEDRELALPDFQRSFVWDPGATRELVASIIRSFPAGSLLLMQGGASVFRPREFEEAPKLNGTPAYLVLDGQQRLTSLYQAFSGTGSHRFFLNLQELLDGYDVDEAVEVYSASRARRWDTIQAQAVDLMLPLSQVRSFADWKDEVLDALEGRVDDPRKLSRQLNELDKDYVHPVEQYVFPVTTISQKTPPEAVCTIFETLNRTGVKLSVFELITARAFAKEFRLREMWETAQATYPVLTDFEINPYYILQIIALVERGSPKRGVVLALPVEAIVERWNEAVSGLAGCLRLLRDECGVLVTKWLPYGTMLIPMAAAWGTAVAKSGPAEGARRAKLKRWFWCSAFMGYYDNSPNTMAERDMQDLIPWLKDEGPEPSAVRNFTFTPDRWRSVTYRQRALYRASIALLMRYHPLDFHSGKPLTKQSIEDEGVDDHHLFPRNYLKGWVPADDVDSVLNRTLIDRMTNIRISDKAPSRYLKEMANELKGDLTKILSSHRLPSEPEGPLFGDRFEDFLAWRMDHLTNELVEATGAGVDEHGVIWAPRSGPDLTETADENGSDTPVGVTHQDLPSDVTAFLQARVKDLKRRGLIEDFLGRIATWPGVQTLVSRSSQTRDGWAYAVRVSRQGTGGSFLYLYPSSMKIEFRLHESEVTDTEPVEIRQVRPEVVYRVRGHLMAPGGYEACVKLARRAYDKTFGKSQNNLA
jgi:hypothetical protein